MAVAARPQTQRSDGLTSIPRPGAAPGRERTPRPVCPGRVLPPPACPGSAGRIGRWPGQVAAEVRL